MTTSLTRDDLRAIGDMQAKISRFFWDENGQGKFDSGDFYLEVTIKVMSSIDQSEVGRFVDEDGWIGFQATARPVAASEEPPWQPYTNGTVPTPQTGAQGR